MITYPTSPGSTVARSSAARIAIAPSSVADWLARPPPRRPKGVLTALTITARLMTPAYPWSRAECHDAIQQTASPEGTDGSTRGVARRRVMSKLAAGVVVAFALVLAGLAVATATTDTYTYKAALTQERGGAEADGCSGRRKRHVHRDRRRGCLDFFAQVDADVQQVERQGRRRAYPPREARHCGARRGTAVRAVHQRQEGEGDDHEERRRCARARTRLCQPAHREERCGGGPWPGEAHEEDVDH